MTAIEFYSLPENVLAILTTFDEEEDGYAECRRIDEELKLIGWDCDWDLSAEIFDVLPLTVVDNNGDTWTRHKDSSADTFYWTADFLPEDITVYCTPFYEEEEGIPFDILNSNGESDFTFVPLTEEEGDMLEEMKKLFSTVKSKI